MNITPNKRKRESALSSSVLNKENNFMCNTFLEIKSLSELQTKSLNSNLSSTYANSMVSAAPVGAATTTTVVNPFEINRKPPKKKKKHDLEDNCFINPALNLNGPDHLLNPFEIKRPVSGAELKSSLDLHCFINTGLNIRVPENKLRNPFEIIRNGNGNGGNHLMNNQEQRNSNLDLQKPSISRAIAIPFTPTVGCRINFDDIPLESLTPCSMLANKLVFNTPVRNTNNKKPQEIDFDITPKKPTIKNECTSNCGGGTELLMSAIAEESIDIKEELDCYQLELENSINEAKFNNKTKKNTAGGHKNLIDLKNRRSFAIRLNLDDTQTDKIVSETNLPNITKEKTKDEQLIYDYCKQLTPNILLNRSKLIVNDDNDENYEPPLAEREELKSFNIIDEENEDEEVVYEEIPTTNHLNDDFDNVDETSDGDFEFKNPAPFVRSFRRKSQRQKSSKNSSTSSLPPANSKESVNSKDSKEEFTIAGIRGSIRKSIRKLLKHTSKTSVVSAATSTSSYSSVSQSVSSEKLNYDTETDEENQPPPSNNLFTTIRQSLRRKTYKQNTYEQHKSGGGGGSEHDVSVLVDTNRQIFKQPSILVKNFDAKKKQIQAKVAGGGVGNDLTTVPDDLGGLLGSQRKSTSSSIRSSFRNTKRTVMKSMFKKNLEEYDLEK